MPTTDAEVEAAVLAMLEARPLMPARDVVADPAAADRFLAGDQTVLAVVAALQRRVRAGGREYARNGRQRVAGDYLQPAALFDHDFRVQSAINALNDYRGPGTGYRLDAARWQEIQQIRALAARVHRRAGWASHWPSWRRLGRPKRALAAK
ncbi:MAG: propanediol/glycerol family dehydratase large subunit [Kouleothrix sp.]